MAVKYELLESAFMISQLEKDVTWGRGANGVLNSEWEGATGIFTLRDTEFWPPKSPEPKQIEKVRIRLEDGTKIIVHRTAPDSLYEDDYTKDIFLEPLRVYLAEEHQVCLTALSNTLFVCSRLPASTH